MFEYFEISYKEALETLGKKTLSEYINDFECEYIKSDKEKYDGTETNDVQKFIRERVAVYDEHGMSRTYLIFAKANGRHGTKPIFVGYYAIAIKPFEFGDDVSRSIKKKIAGHQYFEKGPLPAILIGQLGKNQSDEALNGSLIWGKEILRMALLRIQSVHREISFSLIYLECKDCEKLKKFYSRQGFILHANHKGTPYKNPNSDLVRFIAPVSILKNL